MYACVCICVCVVFKAPITTMVMFDVSKESVCPCQCGEYKLCLNLTASYIAFGNRILDLLDLPAEESCVIRHVKPSALLRGIQ